MADKKEPDVTAGGGDEKKGGNKLVLILVIVLVLVLGGGGAAFFLLKGGGGAAATAPEANKVALGKRIPLEAFIVNLNEAKSTRYLKINFSVELGDDSLEEMVKERQDLIRDRVLTYLSGLTIDDVRGSETKELIRDMLVQRTNEALGKEGAVKSVLFTEFVVQ